MVINHLLSGMILQVGGGFRDFLCSPLLVEDFQFDVHIFQMGWFNHQLGVFVSFFFGGG